MAFETGIDVAQVVAGLERLKAKITWWPEYQTIFVHNFYKHQRSQSNKDTFRQAAVNKLADFALPIQQAIWCFYPDLCTLEGGVPSYIKEDATHPLPTHQGGGSLGGKETVTVTVTGSVEVTESVTAKETVPVVSLIPSDVVKPTLAANASGSGAKPHQRQAYSPQFEEFWLAYPQRNGTTRGAKGEAAKIFARLSADDRRDVVDAVCVYAKLESTKRNNGQYIPDAAKWLRGEKWLTVEEEALAEAQQRANGGKQNDRPRQEFRTSAEKNGDNLRDIYGHWEANGLGADYSPGADGKLVAGR
jgi:hypothetical protein